MSLKLVNGQSLFHGSNILVLQPDLDFSHIEVDFGPGFYCTIYENQAKEWGYRKMLSSPMGQHFVVTEYRFSNTEGLVVEEFPEPDLKWFKAVMQGRNGKRADADIVIGPVADSNLRDILYETEVKKSMLQEHLYDYPSVADYKAALDEIYREAARKAVPGQFRNDNQTVFITEKGISCISFYRAFVYDKNRNRTGMYDENGIYHDYTRKQSRKGDKDKDVRRY